MDTQKTEFDAASITLDADSEARLGVLASAYGLSVPETKRICYALGELICNRIPPDTQVH